MRFIFIIEEKERKLKEKEDLSDKLNLSPDEELYKSITGEQISLNSTTQLSIYLSSSVHKEIVTSFEETKTQLNGIHKLIIYHLSNDQSSSINEFLSHLVPSSLPILYLSNWSLELIEVSSIKDGLVNSLPKVTEQILLDHLEFKGEEVEEIIKSSSQVNQLVFFRSKME